MGIKAFFDKPRKGKMFEFASYLMYNPKPFQQIINIVSIVQPFFYGFFMVLFYLLEYYVVFIVFGVMFVSSVYALYKHIRYKTYRGNKISISEAKNGIFKPKKSYSSSKIVVEVKEKYGR